MATEPLAPPLQPQLAKPADELPVGEGWSYEPKLDGFRVIAFVNGDDVYLQSRNGKPLNRYFPEVSLPPGRYVLDGELVVADADGREQFETLQQRIHPAESRITRLSKETPAEFRSFDLLEWEGESLLDRPFQERRGLLEQHFDPVERTDHVQDAKKWMERGEGVIAKRVEAPYLPGQRKGMVKVRRVRTLDCAVIGWRESTKGGSVASLVLGLREPDGSMRHVGHTRGFTAKRARELVEMLRPLETGEFGEPGPSRWSGTRERESTWRALRPQLVAEVAIDHVSDGRIRHGARFLRWRDDKTPDECGIDQLDG
jgi:ATP-dependent DNA ligase